MQRTSWISYKVRIISGNLITAGIQIFERIYLASMIDIIVAWMKIKFGNFKKFFINLTMESSEQALKDDPKTEVVKKKAKDSDTQNPSLEGILTRQFFRVRNPYHGRRPREFLDSSKTGRPLD